MLLKNTITLKHYKNKIINKDLINSLNDDLMYFTISQFKDRCYLNSDFLWNWILAVNIESDLDLIQKFMMKYCVNSSGEILCIFRDIDTKTNTIIKEKKRKIKIIKRYVKITPSHFEFKQTYRK